MIIEYEMVSWGKFREFIPTEPLSKTYPCLLRRKRLQIPADFVAYRGFPILGQATLADPREVIGENRRAGMDVGRAVSSNIRGNQRDVMVDGAGSPSPLAATPFQNRNGVLQDIVPLQLLHQDMRRTEPSTVHPPPRLVPIPFTETKTARPMGGVINAVSLLATLRLMKCWPMG